MRDPPQRLDHFEVRLERISSAGQLSQELEFPPRPADSTPRLEEVLDSFALGDSSGEQERAGVLAAAAGNGVKATTVGGVRDDAEPVARGPVSH